MMALRPSCSAMLDEKIKDLAVEAIRTFERPPATQFGNIAGEGTNGAIVARLRLCRSELGIVAIREV